MNDVTVIWTGPESDLGRFGLAQEGQQIELPENIANSFVLQGRAKYIKSKVKEISDGLRSTD